MFRIKPHKKGYVVEEEKTTWLGIKYWTHFISVYGIDSEPWYFDNDFNAALDALVLKIKYDTIKESTKYSDLRPFVECN